MLMDIFAGAKSTENEIPRVKGHFDYVKQVWVREELDMLEAATPRQVGETTSPVTGRDDDDSMRGTDRISGG